MHIVIESDTVMEIVYKKVNELIEHEDNARRNDTGVAKVAESIKQFVF